MSGKETTAASNTVAATTADAEFDAQVEGIASLSDPIRRALYRYVVTQPNPVSRDQAAEGVGVARHAARFHLDKLLDDGLLAVEYARPPGRRGPGAGRPAKLYSRSSRELAVSLPQRDYEFAGRLLATAFTTARNAGVGIDDALADVARDAGRTLGLRASRLAGPAPDPAAGLACAVSVLRESGYEPRASAESVTLVNCPFRGLAVEFTDLVCGMNLDLLTGFVDALDVPDLEASLEPTPGMCCIRLYQSKETS